MSHIYVNGEIKPHDQAFISVTDLSYQFGEGVFETFRSYDGQCHFLEDHLARLEWTCTYLNIPFAVPNLLEIATTLLQKNQLKDARFKVVLSQTSTHRGEPPQTNCVIFCDPLDAEQIARPFKLKTIQTFKNDDGVLATLKTTNYLAKRLAKQEALDGGFDDGILLNSKNQVTETTSGNLFWVNKDGQLKTILKDCHHLPGIMKKQILSLLKQHGLKCGEEFITANDFSHAREIFMTNAVVGLKPVVMVDHRQISGGEPGNITLMIQDLWQKHLKELLKKEVA